LKDNKYVSFSPLLLIDKNKSWGCAGILFLVLTVTLGKYWGKSKQALEGSSPHWLLECKTLHQKNSLMYAGCYSAQCTIVWYTELCNWNHSEILV
jgi:hypothetical protein